MTVSELRDILSLYDPTMTVYIEGYEGGYEDIAQAMVEPMMIVRDEHEGISVFGPHEEKSFADGVAEMGITIRRKS